MVLEEKLQKADFNLSYLTDNLFGLLEALGCLHEYTHIVMQCFLQGQLCIAGTIESSADTWIEPISVCV